MDENDHRGMVEVSFSEVHWYKVRVPWAELKQANGGEDIAGLAGLLDENDEIPEEVGALLDVTTTEQPWQVDGREIHSVRRVEPQS